MATLKDISRYAGVNTSTVSRYLSGELRVRPETERQIRSAIEKLGYRPNYLAKALKTQVSKIIGIIVPSSQNPLFAEIVSGIYSVLTKAGYAYIQTASENSSEEELRCYERLCYRQVDGIIVIGSAGNESLLESHFSPDVPVIFINRGTKDNSRAGVVTDFTHGAAEAVRFLYAHGARKIGMLTGIRGLEESEQKEEGYRQGLSDCSLIYDPSMVKIGKYRYEEGYQGAKALIEEHQVDAIFAANDLMAISAMACAKDHGMEVGDQISVIGYGNSEASAFTTPKLTTIDQSKRHSGEQGARAMLHLLAGYACQTESITPTLLVRESQVPIPGENE